MEDQQDRGSSAPLYILGGLLAAGVLMLAAWNIELPYLAFSAGPVSDAADAIQAEGVPVYPPEGELLMLTVVSQDVNVFEAIIVGLDPTMDLIRREAYRLPDESDEDYRDRVLQQMDDSQQTSIAVAMRYLGYEMEPLDIQISDVSPDVPAAEVLEPGDSVDSLNGLRIANLNDVSAALEGLDPGETIEMGITRSGSDQVVSVELVERPDAPGEPMIGITVRELTEPPFPLTIDTGVIGGPSAGMMHTLAIIDTLTDGELTHGHVVAGTGTISPDGTVGNIGGIRQKVVGAEAAGAEFMLVPEGNYEQALTAERHTIELVPVANVEEALAFLETLPDSTY